MSSQINRACIIVLDSLGVGALPDAADYGDAGTDTLGHILDEYPLDIPNLRRLGLGNVVGAAGGRLIVNSDNPVTCPDVFPGRDSAENDSSRLVTEDEPAFAYGRFAEGSAGKDTITGHWEIAGIQTEVPFLTFSDGFPQELMDDFVKETGYEYLGNVSMSGTEIIELLGPEHERTGKPIVYTSADSVFQIAANTAVIPLEELYRICEISRKLLVGQYAVGRVIARPYIIDENGKRVRTADRHDYALDPPKETLLDQLKADGQEVYCIGKIRDIFNGCGVTTAVHTEDNDDGVTKTIEALQKNFHGLIFTNLVDFDSKYGHRRDPAGYGNAIEEFDRRLPEILSAMREDDLLILCSDHGNDPVHTGFNHTREHIFGLFAGAAVKPNTDLGTGNSFADIGATVIDCLTDGRLKTSAGTSRREEILR